MDTFHSAKIKRIIDTEITELIGIARGILADGTVVQSEAEFLLRWLENNKECADTWPANVIYSRLKHYLNDNILTPDEEGELMAFLIDLTGGSLPDPTSRSHSAALNFSFPEPMVHANKLFCITGKFYYGIRKDISDIIIAAGGSITEKPTMKTDYLLIGELGSDEWIQSSFGRKLESAIKYQEKGSKIKIVSESHWHNIIEKMHIGEFDPEKYFSGWEFKVEQAHYPAFDIIQRDIIDQEKTTQLRESKKEHLMFQLKISKLSREQSSKITNQFKITKKVWRQSYPINYDFHEGDVFWNNKNQYTQVSGIGEMLEVLSTNSGKLAAYKISSDQLANWLKTGVAPMGNEINPGQCKRESDRLAIINQGPKGAE
ncbi:MAG: BRCT domain-containing protein [Gammaproteobacteria bacterium]|nr:BRCT domain-containing protein [Gammaproteobacteria bacterium]